MSIQREKLKPLADVPLAFTLEAADGTEVSSQYNGTEYRFSVTSYGRPCYIYLPAQVRQQILCTGAQAGDQIELVKSMRGREATYSVQVLSDAAEPQPSHATHLRGNYPNGQTTASPAAGPVRPSKPSGFPPRSLQPANGNGRNGDQQPPAAPAFPEEAPGDNHPLSAAAHHMAKCLCDAVDAIAVVQEYQRAKGVAADFGDIRALGLSAYINDNQRSNGGAR